MAVKATGDPASPAAAALAVCVPAVVPRTRVALAMPAGLLIELGVIDPPPPADQVTVTPLTGFVARSVMSTV